MAQRLGLDVQVLDAEWGEAAPVDRIAEALAADAAHQIQAVMIVHNETATGVRSDVAGVRNALDAAKHPALLFVDGVSSIGAIDFRMDEWKVDCAVTGTQKALMLPPGAGIVCVSQKAIAAGEQARLARVVLQFQGPDQPERRRLLSVHAVGADAVRPARVGHDAARGRARERLRQASSSRRRRPRGRQGLGPRPVRESRRSGTPTRSAPSWCRRTSRARTSSTSPTRATTCHSARASPNGGEAVPHRAHGRPQRADAARRARRHRDGASRRRRRGGRRAAALARPRNTGRKPVASARSSRSTSTAAASGPEELGMMSRRPADRVSSPGRFPTAVEQEIAAQFDARLNPNDQPDECRRAQGRRCERPTSCCAAWPTG